MKQSYNEIPEERQTLPCQCLLAGRKLFSCRICNKSLKKSLDKIPEMFVNCKQRSYKVTFLIEKSYFLHFHPTDLVNTETFIPLGVGE